MRCLCMTALIKTLCSGTAKVYIDDDDEVDDIDDPDESP